MPQSQAVLVRGLTSLDEAQRRKLQLLGLASHDQVQHDRHRDEQRAAEQSWSDKSHFVNSSSAAEQWSSRQTRFVNLLLFRSAALLLFSSMPARCA